MKKIFCYIKAIPFFIKSGVWCPHIYKEESRQEGIIITTQNSFRIANDFSHNAKEMVHPKATIIKHRCIHCGSEDVSWHDSAPIIISE